MLRTDIINALARANKAHTYLEIGVQHGRNFDAIGVEVKWGVDPSATVSVRCPMTSDEFFRRLDTGEIDHAPQHGFDLVFIDGSHLHEQVVIDVMNARRYLSKRGIVVMHDCSPPTINAASRNPGPGTWCGDVWRAWLELRRTLGEDQEMFVVDTDLGVGVILPPSPYSGLVVSEIADQWFRVPSRDEVPQNLAAYGYWQFNENRARWLNLHTPEAFSARFP